MTDDFLARISSILGSAYVVERELAAGMSRVVVARETALGRQRNGQQEWMRVAFDAKS